MQSLQFETLMNIIGSGPSSPLPNGTGGVFDTSSPELDFESLLTGLLLDNPHISPIDSAHLSESCTLLTGGGPAADITALKTIIDKLSDALEQYADSGKPFDAEVVTENILTEQEQNALEKLLTGDSQKLADMFAHIFPEDGSDADMVLSMGFGKHDDNDVQSAEGFILQLCKRIQIAMTDYAQSRSDSDAMQTDPHNINMAQQQNLKGAQLTLLLSAIFEKLQTVADTFGEQSGLSGFTSLTQGKVLQDNLPAAGRNFNHLKDADHGNKTVKELLGATNNKIGQGNTTIDQFVQKLAALSSDKNQQSPKPSSPLQEALKQVLTEQKPQPSPQFQQNMHGGQQQNPFMQQGNASLLQKLMQQFAAQSGDRAAADDKGDNSLFDALTEKHDAVLPQSHVVTGEDIIIKSSTLSQADASDHLNTKNIFMSDDGKQTISLVDKTQMAAQAAVKPSVNPSVLIDQITDTINAGIHRGESRVTLQLHPPSLGKLDISLSMDKNHLQAIIMTESNQIRHLLEANIDQLRNTLESHNIEVDKMTVQVGTEQSDQFSTLLRERNLRERNNFSPAADNDGDLNAGAETGVVSETVHNPVSITGGIDVFA